MTIEAFTAMFRKQNHANVIPNPSQAHRYQAKVKRAGKMVREISILLRYEKHPDGCFYIRSDDIRGFRLEGPDFAALQRDLDAVVSDLLRHNMGFDVESIRWVPTPDDVRRHLEQPSPDGVATYVATIKAAA